MTADEARCELVANGEDVSCVTTPLESAMASTEQWQPDQEIGTSYVIEECVEKGGMGVVYRARHKELDRLVAIKAVRDIHALKPENVARFQSEGKILARIHHPHVVQVYDLFEHDGAHYMAMEWLEGRSLGRRLKTGVALGVSECVRLFIQVCAGVEVAHQAGVIHRDLKPDNIFLVRGMEGEESAKVVDFGIARGDVSYTATDQILGTPPYMSPEQWRDSKDLSAASDQFSFGVVAYHCATGRLPFDAESRNMNVLAAKVQAGVYTPLRELRPELPEGLCAVIERLLQVDPARRYGSMREAGAALLAFADEDTRGRYAWEFRSRASESESRRAIEPVQGDGTQGAAEVKAEVAAIPPTMPLQGYMMSARPTSAPRGRVRWWRVSALMFALSAALLAFAVIVWLRYERNEPAVARGMVRTLVPAALVRAPVSEPAQPPPWPTVQPTTVVAPAKVGPARHAEQRNPRMRQPERINPSGSTGSTAPAGSGDPWDPRNFRRRE